MKVGKYPVKKNNDDSPLVLWISIIALVSVLVLLFFVFLYCYQNRDLFYADIQPEPTSQEFTSPPSLESTSTSPTESISSEPADTEPSTMSETPTVSETSAQTYPTVETVTENTSLDSASSKPDYRYIEVTDDVPGSILFEHTTDDNSYYRSERLLIKYTYDRIIVSDQVPHVDEINDMIKKDSARFLSHLTSEELERNAQSPFLEGGDEDNYFHYTADSVVVNNSDRIFSICIAEDWMMGGVHNRNYYGLNFDPQTGKEIELSSLFQADNATVLSMIQEAAIQNLSATFFVDQGFYSDWKEIIRNYSLSDLLYFFQNNELILAFPTYSLQAGSGGSICIRTGIYF